MKNAPHITSTLNARTTGGWYRFGFFVTRH